MRDHSYELAAIDGQLERIAAALERLADVIAPLPINGAAPGYASVVAAALDVATDTDDPDADALIDAAMDALNAVQR